jgi:hypothetical protein
MRHIDREATILELVARKRVLHLGAVGHDGTAEGDPERRYQDSLHGKIERVAAGVIGVDTNSGVISEYVQAGVSTMLVGDVEQLGTLDLEGPFDVILSGNVIEHLSNPGRMLDGMQALSHPGTTILVTTPHAFGLAQYVRYVLGRFRESPDHVATFNGPALANLIQRHGFRVISVDTCHDHRVGMRPRQRLVRLFLRWFPHLGRTLLLRAELAPSRETAAHG